MISDATFDKLRQVWGDSIPERYRFKTQGKGWGDDSAIILPMPPLATLERWAAALTASKHLRDGQRGRPKVAPKRGKRQSGVRMAA
jgi:hypothetical protein